MDQSNRNQVIVANARAVAAANNADQRKNPPPYLKLNADCWEHIFDYLSLKDILVMGQTCKRMHQMAGYYVREYLPEQWFELIDGKVTIEDVLTDSCCLRTDFYQYIRSLCIKDEIYDFLDADAFSSLKTIMFITEKLSTTQIQYTQNVLENVENLHLYCCPIPDADIEVIEQLIAYCPKLKYFRVRACYVSNLVYKSIFAQHFPSLELLNFAQHGIDRTDELKTFLETHPKLKHFECDYSFLWANRDLLLETNNIQLDKFTVVIDTYGIQLDQFVDFLQTLRARGFYKTFHFYCCREFSEVDVEILSNFMSKLPLLETLQVLTDSMVDFSRLTKLKKLDLNFCRLSITDAEIMAKTLVNLERLSVYACGNFDDIIPFIRYSKKLKSIDTNFCYNDYLNYSDLLALNEERKQHDDASRVILYLDEESYLLTKWNSQNVNLSHIELRRIQNYCH